MQDKEIESSALVCESRYIIESRKRSFKNVSIHSSIKDMWDLSIDDQTGQMLVKKKLSQPVIT
jgi:hypothetical protein